MAARICSRPTPPQRLGAVALRSLEEYAPDAADAGARARHRRRCELGAKSLRAHRRETAARTGRRFSARFRRRLRQPRRTTRKTATPLRARPKSRAVCSRKSLPPFIGIRIKPLNEDLRARSIRTLDIFITALLARNRRQVAGQISSSPFRRFSCRSKCGAAVRFFEMLERETACRPAR